MRSGRLDRIVTIQQKVVSRSNTGQEIVTWTTLSTRPATISYLSGDERFVGEQLVAKEQVEFTVRWASALAGLAADDRVIYPSNDSPSENQIFDVIQVAEIGRREGLKISAYRRAS